MDSGSLICVILSICLVVSGLISERSDDVNIGEPLLLTKYIENGEIQTAQELAKVNLSYLPIESYAGYFTVNKEFNSNLFFWYFPAKENPKDASIVLWLHGGPGVSGLVSTFLENGPFNITLSKKLIPNEYSWHLNHHLIYIDNPVGTGYSFTDSDDGYSTNEVEVGQNLLSALHQFFVLFPNLQKNEFFASGVSYAGKYVPAIGYAIHQDLKNQTKDRLKPKIKLGGLAIANGLVDPINQINYADYLYQIDLIDLNGQKQMTEKQNQVADYIKNRDFQRAFDSFDELIVGIRPPYGTLYKNLTGLKTYHFVDELSTYIELSKLISGMLVDESTRREIHVGNKTYNGPEKVSRKLALDFVDSVAHWVAELLDHYPIMFYNGQLDVISAYPMTVNFLSKLKFNGSEEYKIAKRNIWRLDNEIVGYTKQAGNLVEVLVRNVGHFAGYEYPKAILDLLLRFTQHRGFD